MPLGERYAIAPGILRAKKVPVSSDLLVLHTDFGGPPGIVASRYNRSGVRQAVLATTELTDCVGTLYFDKATLVGTRVVVLQVRDGNDILRFYSWDVDSNTLVQYDVPTVPYAGDTAPLQGGGSPFAYDPADGKLHWCEVSSYVSMVSFTVSLKSCLPDLTGVTTDGSATFAMPGWAAGGTPNPSYWTGWTSAGMTTFSQYLMSDDYFVVLGNFRFGNSISPFGGSVSPYNERSFDFLIKLPRTGGAVSIDRDPTAMTSSPGTPPSFPFSGLMPRPSFPGKGLGMNFQIGLGGTRSPVCSMDAAGLSLVEIWSSASAFAYDADTTTPMSMCYTPATGKAMVGIQTSTGGRLVEGPIVSPGSPSLDLAIAGVPGFPYVIGGFPY
jgi:hypothetical protein